MLFLCVEINDVETKRNPLDKKYRVNSIVKYSQFYILKPYLCKRCLRFFESIAILILEKTEQE